MKLKTINLENGEIGEYKSSSLKESETKEQCLYLANKNQWASLRSGTACSKTRGEVNGGGSKPYRQKGTGRARRGTSSSPLIKGGGVIFGPKPRSYSWKLNKRIMSQAIMQVIASKKKQIRIVIGSNNDSVIKTKQALSVISNEQTDKDKKTLLIVARNDMNIERSLANINNCKVLDVNFMPISILLESDLLLITEDAVKSMEAKFRKWK
jgi:large subunit ribosomal protein L4